MRPRKIKPVSGPDNRIIASLIPPGSRVLDLGCGEGDLLDLLVREKGVAASGVEKDEEAIYKCVEKGLSVSRLDIDAGLDDYPDGFFDYVIFNQVLQQVLYPRRALLQGFRVGRRVIVGFPNFCHLSSRLQIMFRGRVPVTEVMPYSWYDSPNLHFLSLKDFLDFCRREGLTVEKEFFLSGSRRVRIWPNLWAERAILCLSRPLPPENQEARRRRKRGESPRSPNPIVSPRSSTRF